MTSHCFRRALVRCDRCQAEYEVRWPGTVKVLGDGTKDFQPLHMQTVCRVCRHRNQWYWLKWLGPIEEVSPIVRVSSLDPYKGKDGREHNEWPGV